MNVYLRKDVTIYINTVWNCEMFTFNYGVNELNTCSDNEHQLTSVLFYLLYLKKTWTSLL